MLTYLPDYTALIQLLVGSVIVSVLFLKRLNDPLQDLRNSVNEFFSTSTTLPDEYELISSDSFVKNLSALRKSLMLVLCIYGCMVLFYCANFPNEYTTEPLKTNLNGTALSIRNDFIQPIPSPLGIAILSIIILVYQLFVIIKPSTKIHSNNILFILGIVIMFVVFFIFTLAIPSFNPNLSFMGNSWGNLLEINWVKTINCIILLNLVLWIGFYCRIFLASTTRFINRKKKRWNEYSYKARIANSISLKIGILDSLQYIIEELEKENTKLHKWFLFNKARKDLKKDKKYFYSPNESPNDTIILSYDTTVSQKLMDGIDQCSSLSKLEKRILKHAIRTEPKAPKSTNSIGSLEEKPKEPSMQQLIRLGILRKKG